MGSPTTSWLYLAAFHLLFIWFSFHGVHAESEADQITCFYYDGVAAENNTLCPGSNACCGYQATCLSNRLCHNPSDSEGTYVRGPCAIDGWDSSCAQICLYGRCFTTLEYMHSKTSLFVVGSVLTFGLVLSQMRLLVSSLEPLNAMMGVGAATITWNAVTKEWEFFWMLLGASPARRQHIPSAIRLPLEPALAVW